MPIQIDDKTFEDFDSAVEHIKRTKPSITNAEGYVAQIERKQKGAQLRAKILKTRIAIDRVTTRERELSRAKRVSRPYFENPNFITNASDEEHKQNRRYVESGIKIRPPKPSQADRIKMMGAKSEEQIAKEHHHSISIRYAKAESIEIPAQKSGKYLKYFLLTAKNVNGNGWGVSPRTLEANIKKFIGKPFVVTAKSWIPNSDYDDYVHPHLPTNDIRMIMAHQEKYRVGSIKDVFNEGDNWYANVEMMPKYANMEILPFCSPALFQIDPHEPENQISKWEALHLAGLDKDPAYGPMVALLKGTCIGTPDECRVQFKGAKLSSNSRYPENRASFLTQDGKFISGGTVRPDGFLYEHSDLADEIEKTKPGDISQRFTRTKKFMIDNKAIRIHDNGLETNVHVLSPINTTQLKKLHNLIHKENDPDKEQYYDVNGDSAHNFKDFTQLLHKHSFHPTQQLSSKIQQLLSRQEEPTSRFNPKTPLRDKVPFGPTTNLEDMVDVESRLELEKKRQANPKAKIRMPKPTQRDFVRTIHAKIRQLTGKYEVGVSPTVKINPQHGKIIADAYDSMKHDPNNPEVKSSYDALISETGKQFKDLIRGGLKIDKIKGENPYPNSASMHKDIEENNHLHYFPTESGFGNENGVHKDHPMLQPTEFKHEGQPMLANDVFRIVHDINGHHLGGKSGFGPKGEHQAYLTHRKMYSPKAHGALATETMGQNNWVNFGPHGEKNRANPKNTVYAEQKAGLLPKHIINGVFHNE